ncbi:hypothetical protein KIW84_012183 [Lathyrus oleraceus]|uniref:Uncharacterized protein n=1 Tax=Pisum sativum TaxID=3888 RepID=A0A9D5BGX2_PEA|nr:hypothetical protein KIW84_076904 [Pisum sativum]KAI5443439.1 hypothetical protein KIW84_012182 [Pisum sativum]KAI5443440.1 hypothetical protein KIW84_012183 [Pisum sativum]
MRVSKSVLVGKYSADQVDQVVSLYETLGQQYRWSSAVKRMPLVFLQDILEQIIFESEHSIRTSSQYPDEARRMNLADRECFKRIRQGKAATPHRSAIKPSSEMASNNLTQQKLKDQGKLDLSWKERTYTAPQLEIPDMFRMSGFSYECRRWIQYGLCFFLEICCWDYH